MGPVISHEALIVERFSVPVRITADKQAKIKLTLINRTDRDEWVNFAYFKYDTYTEDFGYDIQTNNEWVFVPVEATSIMRISGVSD